MKGLWWSAPARRVEERVSERPGDAREVAAWEDLRSATIAIVRVILRASVGIEAAVAVPEMLRLKGRYLRAAASSAMRKATKRLTAQSARVAEDSVVVAEEAPAPKDKTTMTDAARALPSAAAHQRSAPANVSSVLDPAHKPWLVPNRTLVARNVVAGK